jgi:hypothetical protein
VQNCSIPGLIEIELSEVGCVGGRRTLRFCDRTLLRVSYVFICLLLLTEKLTGEKLDVPEVTQSEEGQKQKLRIVLAATNRVSLSTASFLS